MDRVDMMEHVSMTNCAHNVHDASISKRSR